MAIGVDVEEAVTEERRFGLPNGRTEGDKLAVEVGFAHGVAVDDGEGPYSGTAELFGGIAAHAAKADDKYMRPAQTVDALWLQEQLCAGVECRGHGVITSSITTSSIIIHGLSPLARCQAGIRRSGLAMILTKRILVRLTGMVSS